MEQTSGILFYFSLFIYWWEYITDVVWMKKKEGCGRSIENGQRLKLPKPCVLMYMW